MEVYVGDKVGELLLLIYISSIGFKMPMRLCVGLGPIVYVRLYICTRSPVYGLCENILSLLYKVSKLLFL